MIILIKMTRIIIIMIIMIISMIIIPGNRSHNVVGLYAS